MKVLIQKLFDIQYKYTKKMFEMLNGKLTITFVGDDLGSQHGPLMSPKAWRQFYKPYFKKYCSMAHENSVFTYMHCDGAIIRMLPDIIDCGVDVLDPLMPTIPEMDPYKVIPEYIDRIAFHGTIDVQELIPHGNPDQIKSEVKQQLDTFYPLGGFFFGFSHCIQPGAPIENIVAVFSAVNEYF